MCVYEYLDIWTDALLISLESEDVKRTTLRELKVLRMLKQENIVQLRYLSMDLSMLLFITLHINTVIHSQIKRMCRI